MGLTVREKDHWRERISRRIDHAIEALQAEHDPHFRRRVSEEAERMAWESLSLDELRSHCQQIKAEIERLEEQRRDAWAEMLATVQGVPLGEVRTQFCEPHEVRAAVRSRRALHERELLEKEPLGQRILRLEREKEELLDTVWLATSPAQIKELWSKFAEVLQWEPPDLQKEALAIPAASDQPSDVGK